MTSGVDDVAVYDEAYGKALDCRDPLGDVITVGGRSDDLYGFRLVGDERPDSRVCAWCLCDSPTPGVRWVVGWRRWVCSGWGRRTTSM